MEQANEPVRVKDSGGSWHPIDLTLVSRDGSIEPRYSASDVAFSDGGDRTMATVTSGGRDLAWRLPATDSALPAPVLDGATATYKNIEPGQDLVVTATPTGFEHSIVLQDRPNFAAGDSANVDLPVATDGTHVSETPQGGIQFKAPDGTVVASAPQPVMWDAGTNAAGQPDNVAPVDVTVTQPGGVTPSGAPAGASPVLSLTPDQSYLASPDTQYPVTVDPIYTTTDNGDTWAENADFTTSQAGSDELRAGTYDGGTHKARSWLRFNTSALSGKTITSATLSLLNWWSQTCSGSAVRVSRVTSDWVGVASRGLPALTWANQPSVTYTNAADNTTALGYSGSCPGGFATWNVTPIVQSWANGTNPNYGFRVNAVDETLNSGWRRYRSTNYSTNQPTLTVNYNSTPGVPTALAVSPARGQTVNTAVPTLRATVSDPDSGDSVSGVFHLYDSTGTELWHSTSGSVVGSGAVLVQVPANTLTSQGVYSIRVAATDGTLSSALSVPYQFTFDPGGSVVPAPVCDSTTTCATVADTPLITSGTTLQPGETRVVAVTVPGVSDPGTVDRVWLQLAARSWTAAGSVTVTDADFAGQDAPSLSYSPTDNPMTGVQTTVQALPSITDSQVKLTNNGTTPVVVDLNVYGSSTWYTADEQALDDSVNTVTETALSSTDPTTVVDDVPATDQTEVAVSGGVTVSQAIVQPPPEVDQVGCPDGTPTGDTCTLTTTETTPADNTMPAPDPNVQESYVAAPGDYQSSASIAVTQTQCLNEKHTNGWTYSDRFHACRALYHQYSINRYDQNGNFAGNIGNADSSTHLLVTTSRNTGNTEARIKIDYIPTADTGELTFFEVSGQALCNVCDSPYTTLRFASPGIGHTSSGWFVDYTPTVNIPPLGSVRPAIQLRYQICGPNVPGGTNCDSWLTVGAPSVRCDAVYYLPSRGCVMDRDIPTYKQSMTPGVLGSQTALHMYEATYELIGYNPGVNPPLSRHFWFGKPNLNRREAIRLCKLQGQYPGCDEYPFASSYQGCVDAGWCDTEHVDIADNRYQGSHLGQFYGLERIMNGDKFYTKATP